MEKTSLKFLSILLVTVLAFVYFAQPIQTKANTDSLDYTETSMSTSEVVELIAGVDDVALGLILGILGFITMTYLTLRNVQLPIENYSQSSFIDKCKILGQYLLDHADDSIKNVLYSVYLYSQAHPGASILTLAPFILTSVPMFFSALSLWLGGSLLIDVSSTAEGLLQQFSVLDWSAPICPYSSALETYWSGSSPLASMLYSVSNTASVNNYVYAFRFNPSYDVSGKCLVFSQGTVFFYTLGQSSLTRVNDSSAFTRYTGFYRASSVNDAPTSSYSVPYTDSYSYAYVSNNSLINPNYFALINEYAILHGIPLYITDAALTETLALSSLTAYYEPDLVTPWSDQVYEPTAGTLPIDIVGTFADIQATLSSLSATVLTLDQAIRIFSKSQDLTLDSAVDTQIINPGSSYVFPAFDAVSKYVRYFFNTLGGYLSFCKGCLNAVTVGEGGLSWLFYGGFIVLICGGVVGKILLG